jgi:hypothetical protein
MWWLRGSEEVEKLLTRESRARLPFGRLFVLYLHPFSLFKDASRGPVGMRRLALHYNRAMRWMLLPYIQRWAVIAVSSFLSIAPAEALAAEAAVFIIPAAAIAVGCCVAVTVIVATATGYVFLGKRD